MTPEEGLVARLRLLEKTFGQLNVTARDDFARELLRVWYDTKVVELKELAAGKRMRDGRDLGGQLLGAFIRYQDGRMESSEEAMMRELISPTRKKPKGPSGEPPTGPPSRRRPRPRR